MKANRWLEGMDRGRRNRTLTHARRAGFELAAALWLLLSCTIGLVGTATAAEPLRPRAVLGGWLFAFQAPPGARSVHLAGEFNGWSTSAWLMSDSDKDGVWTLTVPLESGRSYQYKYVVNGTEWVTDPWAEATDPNNYNNGILFTRRPGEPYLHEIFPPEGGRLSAIGPVSARVEAAGKSVGATSIRLEDLLGRQKWTLTTSWSAATNELSAPLPADLPDGDYVATLQAELTGAPALVKSVHFTLDRWSGRVDAPAFYENAVLYEIFVRSFKDSDGNGTGDFPGLTRLLDYLNDGRSDTDTDLGVDALWLMPVHPSPSYHGYDITDYEGIHPDFGTLDDYRAFVAESHRRGMRVMLDFVVNHSSNRHPYFLDAHRNPASPYSSWFKFSDPRNDSYAGFAGIGAMPELNFRSAAMRDYLARMARFWIDLDGDGDFSDGVDAFRCDVGKGPPHDYWRELRGQVKALRPDFAILGEVWDNAPTIASYFHDQYDMNFDYPLYYATLELLGGQGDPARFLGEYRKIRDTYPAGSQLVRFLDNHDNNRIASVLGRDVARQKLATGILLSLPGIPLIYYGMEIGMEGSKPDPDIRRPMRWDLVEAQTGDPNSLLSWHRRLIRLRRDLPALAARDDAAATSLYPGAADAPGLLVFQRRAAGAGAAALIVANVSPQAQTARITLSGAGALLRGRWRERVNSGVQPSAGGEIVDLRTGWSMTAAPYGFAVFEVTEK